MKPSKIEHIVWPDQSEGHHIVQQITAGELRDNLLLYGPPGTGKSTLAKIVADQLGVDHMNLFEYNGVEHNSTADIDKIINTLEHQWVICDGYERRMVIYDEVDVLSVTAIKRLKGIIDRFTNSVRWVFTTNNLDTLEKADPAFVDRCRVVCMDYAMTEQSQQRFVQHLESLGVEAAELVALNCNYSWRGLIKNGVIQQ